MPGFPAREVDLGSSRSRGPPKSLRSLLDPDRVARAIVPPDRPGNPGVPHKALPGPPGLWASALLVTPGHPH